MSHLPCNSYCSLEIGIIREGYLAQGAALITYGIPDLRNWYRLLRICHSHSHSLAIYELGRLDHAPTGLQFSCVAHPHFVTCWCRILRLMSRDTILGGFPNETMQKPQKGHGLAHREGRTRSLQIVVEARPVTGTRPP